MLHFNFHFLFVFLITHPEQYQIQEFRTQDQQTNIEFFKIMSISKTGKTCEVVQVAGALIGDHSKITQQMCGNMVPDSNTVINPKPCKVKIERCTVWNPYKKTRVPVGEYNLRGSVYYTTDSKHLQTLRRVTGSVWASWYA